MDNPELLKNIEFVLEDSQYDPKKSLSSYHKLKESAEADLIYIWGYGPSEPVTYIAEKEKFPIVSASMERKVSKDKTFTIRFCPYIEMEAKSILNQLRKRGMKRIGIVKTDLAYLDGFYNALRNELKSDEIVELIDSYQPGETDFKSSIMKLRSANYDGIGVLLMSGQISPFYRQSKQLGLNVRTFGTDFFDNIGEAKDAAGAMSGAIFSAPHATKEFRARYVNIFGNDLQVAWAAMAYEFASLTGRLFSKIDVELKPEQIIERYKGVVGEQGEAARFRYNESGEGAGFDFNVVSQEVVGNSFLELD
jgi:ABC-type branched-subunit amino acid transport system substrate-binding protein